MGNELEIILRLLLATALGALIGFQRERAGKPAGLRTLVLISLGAALFTVVSIYGFSSSSDPSRVAAGVVMGIGFIGAGAILQRQRGIVEGLTTAATVWAAAAIGLMAGTGMYLVSTVTTVLILVVLYLPIRIR